MHIDSILWRLTSFVIDMKFVFHLFPPRPHVKPLSQATCAPSSLLFSPGEWRLSPSLSIFLPVLPSFFYLCCLGGEREGGVYRGSYGLPYVPCRLYVVGLGLSMHPPLPGKGRGCWTGDVLHLHCLFPPFFLVRNYCKEFSNFSQSGEDG